MLCLSSRKINYFCNKVVSSISTRNGLVRNISSKKFNFKNNANNNFQKIVSNVGCGIGIAVLFGISNFHFQNKVNINDLLEMINSKTCYCKENVSHDDKNVVAKSSSNRNVFNFLADVVEKTYKSVVYIEINGRHPLSGKNIPISNGSGFIVKEDGLILTNAHVVSHYGQLIVKLHDGRVYYGKLEDIDTESDLATVRIEAKNLTPLRLGSSSDLRPGEFVVVMGNPLTLSHTITAGVVSSTNRNGKEIGLHKRSSYIQTDATIHIGNSGGPLVNLDGEVIGINTMKVTEGISFAIPSDCAVEFLKKSEAKSKADRWNLFFKSEEPKKRKFLGIAMLTLSPAIIKELKESNPEFPSVDHGVLVWRVMIGSPSYESGIKPGDVIIRVNKIEILHAQTVQDFLEKEDRLQLTIKRGQKTFEITVPLVEPVMP